MRMNVFVLAYSNLKRKRIRSMLTVLGVAVAVAVFVSLLGFNTGYRRSLTQEIERMGYHLLITAKGCPYEAATLMLKGGGGLKYISEEVYERIASDPRLEAIIKQLVHSVFSPERGRILVLMGIEKSFLKLRPWFKIQEGRWFSSEEAEEVILGHMVAEAEGKSVGDFLDLPGIKQRLKIVGIFGMTNSQEDALIFLPLRTAQRLFAQEGRVTTIGIKLKNLEEITAFEEDYYDLPGIQIISMSEVKGTILNLVSSAKILVTAVALIAIFVAVIGVLNTILMSVFERTREIGVMKALGASGAHIFKLIFTETFLLAVLGGLLGNLLAFAGGQAVELFIRKFLPYVPSGEVVVITPQLVLFSVAGTVVLSLLAGVYPALRASMMNPISAIRSGE